MGADGKGASRPQLGGLIRLRTLVLACGLGLAALLALSQAAFALSQQGHTFERSFGKKGSAEGQLSNPSGIAVNEKTREVFVVDSANNRIEVFGAEGKFIEVWGWGVRDGKEELETCTKECKAGIAGPHAAEGQLKAPTAIAVDNSTSTSDPSAGDVYVLSEAEFETNTIEKFNSRGEFLGRLTTQEELEELGGVAVDASGNVWAYEHLGEEAYVEGFNDQQTTAHTNEHTARLVLDKPEEFSSNSNFCATPGFAVDATAHAFYADHDLQLFEECPEALEKLPRSLAIPVAAKLEPIEHSEPPTARSVIEGLDAETSTALAVDQSSKQPGSGDVYVDNGTSIAAFDASGSFVQRFGEPELKKGAGVAVDAGTGEVFVADAAKDAVDVFVHEKPGRPQINGLSSQNINPTTTQLTAQIDPHGAQTKYFFEYGTATCPSPSCKKLPEPSGSISAGFGDQSVSVRLEGLQSATTYSYRVVAENELHEKAEVESEELHTFTTLPNPAGLLADGRTWEMVSPPEKHGASVEPLGFGSEGLEGGVVQASEDGNAITYAAEGPLEPEPEANRAFEGVQVISTRGAQGWSTHDIITPREHAEGFRGGTPQEYRFFSSNLSLALVEPFLAGEGNRLQEPPLAPQEPGVEEEGEERGLYRRNNQACLATPKTCYEPLVTKRGDDTTGAQFGAELAYVGATSDLKHVIFQSEARLVQAAPQEEGGLYEWTAPEPAKGEAAKLQYISLIPNAKKPGEQVAVPESDLGNDSEINQSDRNAISKDGSRIFWNGTTESKKESGNFFRQLYMRDTQKQETIQVNAPEEGIAHGPKLLEEEDSEANKVEFQTANSEGSRVFFTDTMSLTTEAKLRPEGSFDPADLYVCEIPRSEGLKCKLKDLTVDPHSNLGETAEVIGTMPGASEDGSTIYFVANGVLAPGAVHGSCTRPNNQIHPEASSSATCNLYVDHYNGTEWEKPKLVAILSAQDRPDWAEGEAPKLRNQTAQVSSSGEYLAFMSDRELTGYNNVDANPEARGPKGPNGEEEPARDEEVFLYNRSSGRLTCVSCNPKGEAPTGVFDTVDAGEGQGLIVDPGQTGRVWENRWLAGSIPGWTPVSPEISPYQSRYLLGDGRLFFNSADALVPQVAVKRRTEQVEGKQTEVGVENVYEYEPEGIGTCHQAGGCVSLISSGTSEHESAFLDASASGNDVFFLTAAQLVASDHESSLAAYDAHVCSEASPCPPPPPPPPAPCTSGESCHTSPPPPSPSYQPGLSQTFSGPGNIGNRVVEAETKTKPKPKALTRAQKLANALASCRKHYEHSRRKRASCERKARRTYGAKRASTHGAKHASAHRAKHVSRPAAARKP